MPQHLRLTANQVYASVPDSSGPPPITFCSSKEAFDRVGYAGPFRLDDLRLVQRLREAYPAFCDRPYGRHRDIQAVRNVFMDAGLRRRLHILCGDSLLLWRTNFFVKIPGSQEIGWHHGKHFQSAECPEILFDEISSHFSVCLALHDMDAMNGGLEVIPGSHVDMPGYHRDTRPYYAKPVEEHFTDEIPDTYLARRRSVTIRAGEFLVFHSALMHRSLPYISGEPRISFVSRFIDKRVTIPGEIRQKLSLMELDAGGCG